MRRYDDPVEVRRGSDPGDIGEIGEASDEAGPGGEGRPEQFLWRGRLWKVRAVLAHWVETGPWWAGETAQAGDLLAERELWRVEAGRGAAVTGSQRTGVFDLAFSWTDGRWQLVGCAD